MTDRRYEPFIDMDRATEATRRRPRTAPVSVPEAAPLPAEQPVAAPPPPVARETPRQAIHWAAWAQPPDENAWARSAPVQDDNRADPVRQRSGTAWLALTIFAIGGSAAYLTYAAVIAPDATGRPGATIAVAPPPLPVSLPDPLNPARSLAELTIVVPPPLSAAPPYPVAAPVRETPPYPAAPPDWSVAPSAWTVVPAAAEKPHPPRHRAERHAKPRKAEARPAKRMARDTRHPLSWYASN